MLTNSTKHNNDYFHLPNKTTALKLNKKIFDNRKYSNNFNFFTFNIFLNRL